MSEPKALEFSSRKMSLKLDGKECKISFPKLYQLEEYNEKIAEGRGNSETKIMREFFESLGMPQDFFNNLEPEHLRDIMGELSVQKKS